MNDIESAKGALRRAETLAPEDELIKRHVKNMEKYGIVFNIAALYAGYFIYTDFWVMVEFGVKTSRDIRAGTEIAKIKEKRDELLIKQ